MFILHEIDLNVTLRLRLMRAEYLFHG